MDDRRAPAAPTVTLTFSLDSGRVITITDVTEFHMVRLEELGDQVRRAAERFVAVASGTFDVPRESYDRLRRALEELGEVRMQRRSLWSRPWSWGESWPYRDPFYLDVAHWEELVPRLATLERHASATSTRPRRVHDARIVGARSSFSSRRCTHRPWPARHRRRVARHVTRTHAARGVTGGCPPHAATSSFTDSGQKKTGI